MEQSFFAKVGQFTDKVEETLIAFFLGAMTMLTFINVIMRYLFNDNILWALELTVFMFAWMVLVGASYGVKKHFHIGVDVVINLAPEGGRKVLALLAVGCCLVFSVLLLIGSWNYWYPFISERAWYETDDIPMPDMFQFLADWLNEGERYEKLPRFIPYMALPLGMALLTFRFAQLAVQIMTGKLDRLIAGHEAEEELEALKEELAEEAGDVMTPKSKHDNKEN
ncbi:MULTISPECIES: TRAP transporter small permease [unclassified Vibrio]|uniref:TRAP transporter small permease n=1 Tax=unclassified Vibrio TaxID=2614977 RepID=UPI0013616202|nr:MULTISPECIES: TRAP transporter small permease [unclassified Vibrio]NAW57497.1 TRAP transporter small permease subunit [Vibrio sp. V36_P2S2PM302]NAX23622.1 TRAP transporter small permease subunit [Vibrio sp. V39_P1S14PM300]NAX23944.1 TRAP transporter small permease subunit [Vibrio sp. V38_P2S17PM301]NAX32284.1 TRAP transporter small permease subunit [Vibrio sp. V37_P2S8PM304]